MKFKSNILTDCVALSFKTMLLLMIPVVLVSLILFVSILDFNFLAWSSKVFSLNYSFFGGYAVSLSSIFCMFFTFYAYEKLSNKLTAELRELFHGNGLLVKKAFLLLFFFFVFTWFASISGMWQSDTTPVTKGSVVYHLITLTLLTPIPFVLHQFLDKIVFRNNGASTPITIFVTLFLLLFYMANVYSESAPTVFL